MGRVFLEVVLPVALVAVLGGLVGHWRKVALPPVSALVFYLFSPALVFHSLSTTTLSANASLRIVAVMLATFVAMYLAARLWSWLAGHDASWRAGFALGATTPNSGNMGLPVAMLAFGKEGFEVAVMNFVAGAVLANSGGIAIAAAASGSSAQAWRAPFRFPAVYAAAAGVLVNALGIHLPVTIDAPITTLAGAAVPVMLVVLGLQLRQAVGADHLMDTVAVNAGRLLIAPVVTWFAATALGLDGIERGTLTVLSAMPTAVLATILATEFHAQPGFVTRTVVTSTVLSMLTLTVLITLVR
ncbi:MAG: AEC family transporter [Chloroflexi bacterium]|nr:MAG: AEC family transporter [Chloroflexota bacterium]